MRRRALRGAGAAQGVDVGLGILVELVQSRIEALCQLRQDRFGVLQELLARLSDKGDVSAKAQAPRPDPIVTKLPRYRCVEIVLPAPHSVPVRALTR